MHRRPQPVPDRLDDVVDLLGGAVIEGLIRPADFGIEAAPATDIMVGDADQAVTILRAALSGESGAAFDVLSLNGGAAIHVGGLAPSLAEGVEAAREILRRGLALKTLDRLRAASRNYVEEIDSNGNNYTRLDVGFRCVRPGT